MDKDDDLHNNSTEDQVTDGQTVDPFRTVGSQQSSPGRTLGGYRLLDELGKGGMGIVYEAETLVGSKKVALKTLRSGNVETLTRLKAEFRVLNDLAHPNLVQLGELDTTCHAPFFTMEIVRGVTFDQHVTASLESVAAIPALPYSDQRLRAALLQLASGLGALHSAGLVHRDIKPSNVMVTSEGRVVILDMGLAVTAEDGEYSTSPEQVAGTPYYMAPEQIQGQVVTAASDWYAVGVMLFEILTGEKLFQSRQVGGLLSEKLAMKRICPRDVLAAVAEDLSDLCEKLLSPDPDARPCAAEVLERLSGTVAVRQEASTWIGREMELGLLHDAWKKVQQGLTQVALVSGRSGIGKTSLVDRFLSELRSNQPVVVLRGRCYENEAVPYRGIDSIVDSLSNYLLRLPSNQVERVLPIELDVLCQIFPVLRGVPAISRQLRPLVNLAGDARDLGQRGISALRELLCRLARFDPVVLFIDDLQQGDEDTAGVLRELFRDGQAPVLLCLGTFRSEAADTSVCLKRIRRKLLSPEEQSLLVEQLEIAVDGLPIAEANELANSLLKADVSRRQSVADWIARESGGDPLFLRMLAEERNLHRDDDGLDSVEKHAFSLGTVIEKRIRNLDKVERHAIEILATAGRPLSASDLESIVENRGGSVGLIRSLRIQKLVKRLGDRERIELYHDKIRETALAIVPVNRQSKHCLKLADHLERNGGDQLDVEFLADLCRRGGDRRRAGGYYQESAKIAEAAFAFNRAIECYRYAIDYLDPNDKREPILRKGMGDALANASRSAEAAGQYLKAAEHLSANEKAHLHQLAALRYLTSGHVEKGIEALRLVLKHHGLPWPGNKLSAIAGLLTRNAKLSVSSLKIHAGRVPHPEQQEVLDACWAAAAGLSLVDPLRGSYYISETLIRSLKTGSSATLPRDLAAYIGQTAIGGSRSRRGTRRILLAARRLRTKDRSDPYIKAMPLMSRGIAALLRGEWILSLKCCDRAVRYLTEPGCFGRTWELNTARTFALWSLQYQGNLRELARRQPELLNAAIEADDLFATLNYGTQVMAHLQLAANAPDESLRRLQEDKNRLSDRGFFIQHHNHLLASAYTHLYMEEYQKAVDVLEDQWSKYQQSFLSRIQQVRIDYFQVYARVLVAAARNGVLRERNMKIVRGVIRKLGGERADWAKAFSLYLQSACLALENHQDDAKAKLTEAANLFERQSMRLFATASLHHLERLGAQVNGNIKEQWESCGVLCGERMGAMLLPGF